MSIMRLVILKDSLKKEKNKAELVLIVVGNKYRMLCIMLKI